MAINLKPSSLIKWLARPLPIAWSLIAGGAFIVGVLFWGGFHTAMKITDNIEFCTSCHSMGTVYEEYKTSVHYKNNSGVRAVCTDCHVPKEWGPYVIAKIKASRDLYAEVAGTIDTREKFEDKRLELAQRVWDSMKATDSRECRNCHTFDAMTIPAQAKDAQAQHPRAIEKGDTCISCHKGLVHTMPDLGPIAEVAFGELEPSIGQIPQDAKTVHPTVTQNYFLDAASETKGGKVLAGMPLAFLGVEGDMVQVRFEGWRQDDVPRVLYADAGKRILVASLSEEAQEALDVSDETVEIEETGQSWTKASLDGWLPKEKLTANTDKLWHYANALYSVNCSACHAEPHVNEFGANKWMGQFKSMVASTNLEKEQARLVQSYLQLHARDMEGSGTAH